MVVIFSSQEFVDRVFHDNQNAISWLLSLPLVFAGGLMVRYGVGELGLWGYLFAFFSTPLMASVFALAVNFQEYGLLVIVLSGIAALLALTAVRSIYERKAKRQTPIQSDENNAG